jgi:hypothetical protein
VFGIIIDVTVDPQREDEARRMLHERIVPKAQAHTGFVAGYWLRALDGDTLRSMHLFDSRENALGAASEIESQGPQLGAQVGVTLQSVETYELVAQAQTPKAAALR